MFKMTHNLVTRLFVVNLIIVKCSGGEFQFRTIKPTLYPFVPVYSATFDFMEEDEREGGSTKYATIQPYDMAWMVLILEATHDYTDLVLKPLCMGIVVTTIDILTTCSCIVREQKDKFSMNLLIKPKTNIVKFPYWDNDLIGVNNVVVHENCKMCNNTSYNDLAILTVQIIDVIHGIVEPIPKHVFDIGKGDSTKKGYYKNCYIVVSKAIEDDNHLKPTVYQLERRRFTIWDVPSPTLGEIVEPPIDTEVIVGRSEKGLKDSYVFDRIGGAPLMCESPSKEHEPVGIYLGLECGDIDQNDLKDECSRELLPCEDCYPSNMKMDKNAANCIEEHSEPFELAIRLNSFSDWLEEYSFELPGEVYLPFQKTSTVQVSKSKIDSPWMWRLLIATLSSFFNLIL
ncbi:hypothetical protein GE061_007535 [Apolygus lucorum]|uniref:Peptidase S1 domain-containing protein n=1 Tax=Apolygus lucorum TaxID=248454 RepID=A0A6A4ISI3_APOLU|nr:hypothetical protein GE061_007535 [Apolygus lucorum]